MYVKYKNIDYDFHITTVCYLDKCCNLKENLIINNKMLRL